jgi:hypothetical protein
MRQMSAFVRFVDTVRPAGHMVGIVMRRVRWDEVEDLVSERPYVGGLQTSDLLNFTIPLINLYVSKDRLVLQPRFGLARLCRPWVVERGDVAYIGARGRGSVSKESVQIGFDRFTSLDFWTWHSWEIVDRLRDLGYPCKPHQGPGSLL